MYSTKEEIESWLIKMNIKNYVVNEDLTIDVNGDVNISFKGLNNFPVKFGIVDGNFYCSHNNLTSFKYFPKEIKGDFDCSFNNLTSLKGCPEIINGNFDCGNNKLTSLKGCPKVVNGIFDCGNNKLTSFKGCSEVVNGSFDCTGNKLTSFKYFPKEINGEFIYMNGNDIAEEELVNFNCNIENVKEIYSDFNLYGSKENFLEKLNFYEIKKENELLKELSVNSNNIKLSKKL